ncbi:hypothetical protein [Streptomyces resistomycificus]|uniref:Uncharacterized protein n=1 Tax=Streptomyces resistomycificus TaxID=67356 RepID=A0A0L8LWN2_9ACTN|nr:hypothetical protein [Streptomyces resistomycificus]KOG42489.1 hypothetical protein ADK37_05050 [Streptomyces resistomycificus]KUN92640.1 hypothetical protein AQJ84_32155 [Streptomyces resistomycificus]
MQRKGGRGGAGPDVEAALDELYSLAPSDFTARREVLAAAARSAGRAEDGRRIHAARRPTLAAWAANLLLRSRPDESRRFHELGQALREAYQTLDAEGVKELSGQSRGVVTALSRQAAQLAREAGHRLSDSAQQDVESTLRAVLTDQDAADRWITGRLESALTPPTAFPSVTAPTAGTRREPAEPAAEPPPSRREAAKKDDADRRRRQEELARARKAAKAATQRVRDQRAARAKAETLLKRLRDRREQARQQVSAAERQLEQARAELERADHDAQEAEKQRAQASDALTRAEQSAHEADEEVRRLAAPAG